MCKASAWRALLDEASLRSHPQYLFVCLAWVGNVSLERAQRLEGSQGEKSYVSALLKWRTTVFLFPWWSLFHRDPQKWTGTQLGTVLLVQKGSDDVLDQLRIQLQLHNEQLSPFFAPSVGGLVARWPGRGASDVQCCVGTISRAVWWSSLRKATQSYLVGSSLRTALISGSSSLLVGVNVIRWAVNKCSVPSGSVLVG